MADQIVKLKKSTTLDFKKLEALIEYHNETVKNLQHERHLHLLVTLAFAAFCLLFLTLFLVLTDNVICYLLGIAALVFLTTDIFYLRHYYHLENETQKLYPLTDELYQLKLSR